VIIDCHGHVSAPAQLWAYKATLLAARGSHGRGGVKVSDDDMRAALDASEIGPRSHLDALHHHGTDVQLISPRPFQLMHSERPARIVQWFAEECDNIIHRQTQMYPSKFFGVASLAQIAGEPIERALPELERCVKQLGFVGTLLNPDPFENSGTEPPALSDRYWYPLYEKLCELDLPAHIHTASSRSERASYSVHLINEGTPCDPQPSEFRRLQRLSETQSYLLTWGRRDPLSTRPF
jgi:OH-DDVA meta-cleavage compound hydrolase